MNTLRSLASAAALFALTPAVQAAPASWEIDPNHSTVQFAVKHMMVSTVRGGFGKIQGTVQYDPANARKTQVDAEVDATTIDTHQPDRDKHLKSADFFDTDKCPKITFKSTKASPSGNGGLKLSGDLTMHCVTKPVTFNVEKPSKPVTGMKGEKHLGTTATATVSRKEFGLVWNKTLDAGGVMVGDDVKITIDLELVQEPAKDAVKEQKKAEEKGAGDDKGAEKKTDADGDQDGVKK